MSFGKSFRKCHFKWDRLYIYIYMYIHVYIRYIFVGLFALKPYKNDVRAFAASFKKSFRCEFWKELSKMSLQIG